MKEDKMQRINDTNKAPGNPKPTQKSQKGKCNFNRDKNVLIFKNKIVLQYLNYFKLNN